MHKHPDGPSYTNDICPQNVPLRRFEGNTVHSQGWFGIWIFQVSEQCVCLLQYQPIPPILSIFAMLDQI